MTMDPEVKSSQPPLTPGENVDIVDWDKNNFPSKNALAYLAAASAMTGINVCGIALR